MTIREFIGIGPAQQGVLGPLHHQTGHGDRMKVTAKGGHPREPGGGFHDGAVQTHAATGIRKPSEADAVDPRIEIGMLTGRLDRIEQA